jgi:hypothetical protein
MTFSQLFSKKYDEMIEELEGVIRTYFLEECMKKGSNKKDIVSAIENISYDVYTKEGCEALENWYRQQYNQEFPFPLFEANEKYHQELYEEMKDIFVNHFGDNKRFEEVFQEQGYNGLKSQFNSPNWELHEEHI